MKHQKGQQCDPNCSGCTTAGLCVSDTLNRCQFNFITFACEPPLCGADCSLCTDNIQCTDDSFCYFLPDTERCVPDNTCSSDCSRCKSESECINGAGGSDFDPICIWNDVDNDCKGTTCNTNCAECLSPNECAASFAKPFGCESDPNNPENCIPITTNSPTMNPTLSPTASPVSIPLFCNDQYVDVLSPGSIQTFWLDVPYDLDTLIISTCEFPTVFETILTLFYANGSIITIDEFGCADDLGRARININDISAGNYSVELSSAIGSNAGKYQISIDCITASPTNHPTDLPTFYPTADPTVSPTQSAECGDVFDGVLGVDDKEFVQFALGLNTNRLVITTCFVFTNVSTELVFGFVDGTEIAFDINGCGDASVIDYQQPLNAGDYIVTLSPAQSPGSGVYRIAFQCFTDSPTMEPTVNPSISPSENPSQNPTKMPTIFPTLNPTNIPSISPTKNPTQIPTKSPSFFPTHIPSLSPTKNPTISPSLFPSNNPSLSPTKMPTQNPSTSPSNNPTEQPSKGPTVSPIIDQTSNPSQFPTETPTKRPSNDPTKNPTKVPTLNPTLSPTLNPTFSPVVIPTDKPTKSPTPKPSRSPTSPPSTTQCPECAYNVSLVRIGNVSFEECPTISSSASGSSESGRRRLLDSSTDSDSEDMHIKCASASESNSESSDGTNSNSLHNSGSMDAWYKHKCGGDDVKWSESDSDDSSDDEFMTSVCITYKINDLVGDNMNVNECGFVKQIFLGLCENNRTDFNSSTIDEEDLSALIVSIEPNDLSAMGLKNDNGELGILVEVPLGSMISEFELCLANVSVDSSFNQEKETIEIGKGSVVIQNGLQSRACHGNGLPCLNFVFDDVLCPDEDKTCECNDGISELSMVYTGQCRAKSVNVYYGGINDEDAALCSFEDVVFGTEIRCGSAPFDAFRKQTFIQIVFDKDDDDCKKQSDSDSNDDDDGGNKCLALFRTDCSRNIVGTQSEGCNVLSVVSFADVNGAYCDKADVLSSLSDIDSEDADGGDNYNALIGEKKESMDTLQIFDDLNPFIKITVISVLTGFGCFIIAVCYLYISRKLRECTEQMHNVRDDINIGIAKGSCHQRIQTNDFDESEMTQINID